MTHKTDEQKQSGMTVEKLNNKLKRLYLMGRKIEKSIHKKWGLQGLLDFKLWKVRWGNRLVKYQLALINQFKEEVSGWRDAKTDIPSNNNLVLIYQHYGYRYGFGRYERSEDFGDRWVIFNPLDHADCWMDLTAPEPTDIQVGHIDKNGLHLPNQNKDEQ